MMLITENGASYADGFFYVENGRVINDFTKRSVGILVRTIPSTNYLYMYRRKRRSMWQRIKAYFINQQIINDRNINYDVVKTGSLKETMKMLEEETR